MVVRSRKDGGEEGRWWLVGKAGQCILLYYSSGFFFLLLFLAGEVSSCGAPRVLLPDTDAEELAPGQLCGMSRATPGPSQVAPGLALLCSAPRRRKGPWKTICALTTRIKLNTGAFAQVGGVPVLLIFMTF